MTLIASTKKCISKINKFSTEHGDEFFLSIDVHICCSFQESVSSLFDEYNAVMLENGLSAETEVSLRFFLSDIANQLEYLQNEIIIRECPSFYSFIGQAPVASSKLSFFAYHIRAKKPVRKVNIAEHCLRVDHSDYSSLWMKIKPRGKVASLEQTDGIFAAFQNELQQYGADIVADTIRTWLYVRDIDNNYHGMVESRKKFFDKVGLTQDSHYITSTGIEAQNEETSHLVHLDALSVLGLSGEQIKYLTAPDFLCSTIDYGVTFERGVQVRFGDRTHFYIAGTASIDHHGEILHVNDIKKQTERALENVDELLKSGGARLDDLQYLTVYLRDPGDYRLVAEVIRNVFATSTFPVNYVTGAVCRPQWLVEVEGVACTASGCSRFSPFC